MHSRTYIISLIFVSTFLTLGMRCSQAQATTVIQSPPSRLVGAKGESKKHRITPVERRAAAKRLKSVSLRLWSTKNTQTMTMPMPGDLPHYFGPYPNYANSPMPTGSIAVINVEDGGADYSAPIVMITDLYSKEIVSATATATVEGGVITDILIQDGGHGYTKPIVTIADPTGSGAVVTAAIGGDLSGGIRKFVDSLPGLNTAGASNREKYIPVAIPDESSYPGCDYYEIELGQYTEQLHSDLPVTMLRGYRQTNTSDSSVNQFHYLGPLIIAQKDVPVRIKFTNSLPTGDGGNLFLPVDTTVMGAGMGPLDMPGMPGMKEMYTQNRATLHLHGGAVPWISDGTPHQWTTPAGEVTQYPKGVSVQNVPDMPDPSDGSLTFYYNNHQSARLMWYHDHSYGITRLNVYAGEAAGYLLTDQYEQDMISGTNNTGINPAMVQILPDVGIPLIIQDKTFVDPNTIGFQDPNWKWGSMPGMPMPGNLWLPSVYMPAQNPEDISGANAFGRWQYGPWFWPPTTAIKHPPIPNPYYQPDPNMPNYAPLEPSVIPDMPNPSMGMEAFMDTPLVNGAAYPYIEVDPKTYRFRILNAANDRFLNLHFYVADSDVVSADGRVNTEVRMVPAMKTTGFPAKWSTDGREGGVPDPATAGPAWIQIGTEGGFLPTPVVINNQPINWNMNATAFNVGNVTDHSLLLGCAERADVIVDFTPYAGKTLILYNDAPAAFPALDPRYDYYTGDPDQTDTGGAPTTQPGFGPNTRTIMQFRISGTASVTPLPRNYYNPATLSTLKSVFAMTSTKRGVFEASQDPIIVPQQTYNSAYNWLLPFNVVRDYVQIFESSKTFTPTGSTTPVKIAFQPKAMHDEMGAAYDTEYGRMSGTLGLEVVASNNLTQNFLLSGYASPPVEVMQDSLTAIGTLGDGTQIWKITHNGVDTHPIHFHLFNVQLINRVAWDGVLLPTEPNELGWKETVRVNPLEDTIIAMRPVASTQPFAIPNSIRLIDPTMPEGALLMTPPGGFVDPTAEPVTVLNHYVNYGWEYMWHCHILSHEEMDMMHAIAFAVAPEAPSSLNYTVLSGGKGLKLTWNDSSVNETGFTVQKAIALSGPWTTLSTIPSASGTGTGTALTYTDRTFKSYLSPNFYRVTAINVVGDTKVYAAPAVGFPKKTVCSTPAQIGPPNGAITLVSVTQDIPNRSSVIVTWSLSPRGDQTGFIVQRATNAIFTTGVKNFIIRADQRVYSDSSFKRKTISYYRVMATNGLGNGSWSNSLSLLTHR